MRLSRAERPAAYFVVNQVDIIRQWWSCNTQHVEQKGGGSSVCDGERYGGDYQLNTFISPYTSTDYIHLVFTCSAEASRAFP